MITLEEFSQNTNYCLDFIPEGLGFFQRKIWLKNKIKDISEQESLIYIEKNKILWLQKDEHEKAWLFFEKAKFFYESFKITNKFVLIIENDENFYGLIDGFLAVFSNNFEEATNLLKEYSNNENIKIYGVGATKKRCHLKKSYEELSQNLYCSKSLEENFSFVNEEIEFYQGYEEQKKPNFDELFILWINNQEKKPNKILIITSIFLSFIFFTLGFYFNNY